MLRQYLRLVAGCDVLAPLYTCLATHKERLWYPIRPRIGKRHSRIVHGCGRRPMQGAESGMALHEHGGGVPSGPLQPHTAGCMAEFSVGRPEVCCSINMQCFTWESLC